MATPPSRRPVRRNGALALGLAVVIALAATPWLFHAAVVQPPAPLIHGLPSAFRAASQVLDARVKARYPPGTAEARLVADLSRQGFRAESGHGGEQQMVRYRHTLVCNLAARVHWRADAAGRIATTRGAYREEGCL